MKTIDELGLTQYKTQQVAWEVLNAIHQMFQSNMGKSLLEGKVTNLLLETYVYLIETYHRTIEQLEKDQQSLINTYENSFNKISEKNKEIEELKEAINDIDYKYSKLKEDIEELYIKHTY